MDKKQSIKELARRWGLPTNEIRQLGHRLESFYNRFRSCMRTKTRDTSEYGLRYVSGLLRMEANRNMANIGRKTDVPKQNMQHFMSNAPWSGSTLVTDV